MNDPILGVDLAELQANAAQWWRKFSRTSVVAFSNPKQLVMAELEKQVEKESKKSVSPQLTQQLGAEGENMISSQLAEQPEREREYISPFLFVPSVCAVGSLVLKAAEGTVGVDQPFLPGPDYKARLDAFSGFLAFLASVVPGPVDPLTIVSALGFLVVVAGIVFAARQFSRRLGRFRGEIYAFSYLVPWALLVRIVDYVLVNVSYRAIGDSPLLFAAFTVLALSATTVLLYRVVYTVVRTVYFQDSRRPFALPVIYSLGTAIAVAGVSTATVMAPVLVAIYRVFGNANSGVTRLVSGDYQGAETLFREAVKADPTNYWSSGARIRLVSVDARYIQDSLVAFSYDAGLRERLLRHMLSVTGHPFRRVAELLRVSGTIDAKPQELLSLREAFLAHYVDAGGVPITNSELEASLAACLSAKTVDCLGLPSVIPPDGIRTPVARERALYRLFRQTALAGEPDPANARRYLQFLAELPTRLELMCVRYRARNLMRDSETLASFDDAEKMDELDRETLLTQNRRIRDEGLKYAHLVAPDDRVAVMSDDEVFLRFRQAYLGYLDGEARALSASSVCRESPLLRRYADSIQENLKEIASLPAFLGLPASEPSLGHPVPVVR